MSQMQSQEPVARPMSSAFRSVPANPYQERAAQTRQQIADMEAANTQQVQTPAPTQQVNGSAIPTSGTGQVPTQQVSVSPTPLPPPTQQVAPQNVQVPVQPQPQPQPQPQSQLQSQPYTDPSVLAQLQQLQQERMYLAEENARQQEAIQQLQAANAEYNALKQRAELQAAITDEAFGELSSIDTEDAKAISRATLNAVQQAMAPVYERLQQTQKQQQEIDYKAAARIEQQRLLGLRDKVLAAHPDFDQIQRTPEYLNYMNQRDGLSSQTRDQRAAQEFRAGNTDYVIDMLNQFKGQSPSVQSIQTVAPVQSAAGSPVATTQPQTYTLRELNTLYHTGQITPEKYRELKPLAVQAWRDAG